MASSKEPPPTTFNNDGRIGVQAQHYTVHGNNTFNVNQRTDRDDQDLLQLLPYAAQAAFNASNKQHASQCLADTRVDLLRNIRQWADKKEEKCMFWLNGMAGTGKSTIALTVAREYHEKGRLGASFFFSRGGGDLGSASKFVTTIAFQLAYMSPDLETHICEALRKDRLLVHRGLLDQWEILVLKPLSMLQERIFPLPLVLVIDALDECEGKDDVRLVLHLLATSHSLLGVQLRIFITSRPETTIRHSIHDLPENTHQDFILHNISPTTIEHDIFIYFSDKLEIIRRECEIAAGWPGEGDIKLLVEKAGGLFIYAATAYRFLHDHPRFAQHRLDLVISGDTSSLPPEKKLDKIYTTVLAYSFEGLYDEQECIDVRYLFRHAVGSIVVLFDTISFATLSELLDIPMTEIKWTLSNLHSVLDIPTENDGFIRLLHPSFRDFLLDANRCSNQSFAINKNEAHHRLFRDCLRVMSKYLRRDMCNLRRPGVHVSDVTRRELDQGIPLHVQYACRYWVQHFQQGQHHPSDQADIYRFFRKYFLFWLEALALMGCISEGVNMVKMLDVMFTTQLKTESNLTFKLRSKAKFTSLRKFVSKDIVSGRTKHHAGESSSFDAFIHDAKRFVLSNASMLEEWPLQVYCGALIFSPMASIVRDICWSQVPTWVKTGSTFQRDWSPYLQTLVGHSSWVEAVAFSPDGKLLASGSGDKTIRLWDATTGAARGTLEGHSGSVTAVAFSPDGKLLASGSGDGTVRLWDATTGAARGTLEGHSGWVEAVAFSPDGKLLASGSGDKTIRLWDATTGAARGTLEGHSSSVRAVAFSPDGKLLASGSRDETVRLWDATTGAARGTLKGHSGWVAAVAFSPDSKLLASGSGDEMVRLWDATTGAARGTFKGHSGWVEAVAFSPDSKLLASGSGDETVKLWDATTGAARGTLEGHSSWVEAVAFSPDGKLLASGSRDRTVKLWDATTGAARSTLDGHSSWVEAVAFSPDGKLLASGSRDRTVKLWDATTGAARSTLEGYSGSITAVAFSPDSKLLASGSGDETVRLWDATTGAARGTLVGHSSWVEAVAFSPDGKLLASGSGDGTVRLWDATTGAARGTLEGHSSSVRAVAFSPDGKLLASGSGDRTIRLWDATTGAARGTLEGHSSSVRAVAFSPDGKLLASGSGDRTIRLWDATTGAARGTLEGHSGSVKAVAFSPDGKLLASGSGDRTIRLWDATTGAARGTLEGHSGWVEAVAFSPDGKLLASGSGDKTIRLWDVTTEAACGTLEVDTGIRNISFLSFGQYLRTDGGILDVRLNFPHTGSISSAFSSAYHVSHDWIRDGIENIVRIPPDYRPRWVTVWNDKLVLGNSFGHASCVEFKSGGRAV